jgi:DNA-binding transcriptional regulator YdaS (Cro superfamily)
MSPIKRAAKIMGSQKELARCLGVSKGAVSQWADGSVPLDRCIPIERLTDGAVRCEDLRPDVDWGYLRATDCDVKVGAGGTASEPVSRAA